MTFMSSIKKEEEKKRGKRNKKIQAHDLECCDMALGEDDKMNERG